MIFDKSKITEDHLNFLNPYIEKTLDIFNNLSSYKDIDEKTITALDDLHKEAISGALEATNKNKLKTYGKVLLSNPYSSRIKVEKLPAPNLYSVLIFSTGMIDEDNITRVLLENSTVPSSTKYLLSLLPSILAIPGLRKVMSGI